MSNKIVMQIISIVNKPPYNIRQRKKQ